MIYICYFVLGSNLIKSRCPSFCEAVELDRDQSLAQECNICLSCSSICEHNHFHIISNLIEETTFSVRSVI